MKRTEVFIAFTKTSNYMELEETLNAWDTDEYEPIGIQVQAHRFDIQRIAAAEAMAKNNYILADIGSRPDGPQGWRRYPKGSMKVEEMTEWPSQSSSLSGTEEPN